MTNETINPADVKMTFSDYIGEPLSEVPVAFLKWNLLRNKHLKPEMRAAMKAVIIMQMEGRIAAGRRDVFLNPSNLKPGNTVMVDWRSFSLTPAPDQECVVLASELMNHITLQPRDAKLGVVHVRPEYILRKI